MPELFFVSIVDFCLVTAAVWSIVNRDWFTLILMLIAIVVNIFLFVTKPVVFIYEENVTECEGEEND